VSVRFDDYCRAKEHAAVAAALPPYKTAAIDLQLGTFRAIGNTWSRGLFDGDFYRGTYVNLDIPVTNLVIVSLAMATPGRTTQRRSAEVRPTST
jgi:hypothetical protein